MARRGHVMSLEQWSVGGRGFGSVFVFLLMAGEIYTTFTFLGGSGWAYGKGAPAFYILCYGAIAYSVSYFLLPIVWRYAQTRRLVSQADFFVAKYESKTLGVVVALVSVAALVPYLVLQLKGLGIIVSEASGGVITQAVAVWTSSIALVGYVVVSGVRGSAWTSALKDVMILAAAVGIGVYLPLHYFGGYRAMFEAVEAAKPGALTLPASGMSPAWFISTVLLTATGFYMWPQFFAGVYTARSENVFRKNAVILPLYQLVVLFVFFTGFAAMLVVPGLKGAAADLSLLRIVEQSFGSWTVGAIGAAGLLTALVPGSMILITAGTIISQNIYRVMAPAASDRTVSLVARSLVPVLTLVAVILTLRGGQTLVVLLLMGYNFVTQLFPALILSLGERQRVSAASAIAGIVAGELTVVFLTVTSASVATLLPGAPQMVKDLNVGFVALAVNAVVLTVVALATRVETPVVTELERTR
ncbi:MAG TPA: sodium:solute symporter family protein [Gemmatimonadaceae bacterium]|nr:sodium:solute symporter family protein [Gemmatimonadaceae bacterium]